MFVVVCESGYHLTLLVQCSTALLTSDQSDMSHTPILEQQTTIMKMSGVRMWIQKLIMTTTENM